MPPKKKLKDPDKPPDEQLDEPRGIDFSKHKTPFKSIKTSIKSIVRSPEIQRKLNDLVIRINDIVIDTYHMIKLFVLKKLNNNEELPILDATFIKYVITTLGTRDARGKKTVETNLYTELQNFYNTEFQPIYNHKKYQLNNLSYTLPYVCESIEISITNNIKEHFIKRLSKFINIFGNNYYDDNYSGSLDINSSEYKAEKKAVIYKLKSSIINNKVDEIPELFREWYENIKTRIIPSSIEKSIAYDCKANPSKYIPISFFINTEYERCNELISKQIEQLQKKLDRAKKEDTKSKYSALIKELNSKTIKLFQLIPLRNSCVPKYIFIDSATLVNVIDVGGKKGELLKELKSNAYKIWDSFFNLDKAVFKLKEYNFNFTLVTDGIGCSLHFKHIKHTDKQFKKNYELSQDLHYIDELSDKQLEEFKDKKIVTADPGKKYLLYMIDDENKVLKYSSAQRNVESLNKRNMKIKETNKKKHQNIINAETELSKYNCKTNSYDKFKEYIKAKYNCNSIIKKYYEGEINRKLNWRTKTYRQRSEDKFLNNIEKTYGKKEDILICIGDWSNKNTIKGLGSTIGLGLKKLVSKRFRTVLIDEYNTSKLCCNCHKENENKIIKSKSLFRLLTCQHCKDGSSENSLNPSIHMSGKFLNRDKNSCINMQYLVKRYLKENRKRPKEFCRTK